MKKKIERYIEQYEHHYQTRLNAPQVGLISESVEPYYTTKKVYQYDPHIEPALQWAGKTEHTSFEVPTQSLHVHERIDPKTIIRAVQKTPFKQKQMSFFETKQMPLRNALEFYKHKEEWSNRLIAGDSLLVMNSLIEKEGMAGHVQMIYIDPPYGIKYGSNFQPFVNKRDVKDRKDEDLTSEPEMIKAFRDTWELGIHSYLTYLRDRLLLARMLLHESGSVFVQISDENVHLVRCLMDEVFGKENFITTITFIKTSGLRSNLLTANFDYLIWYGKDKSRTKVRPLFSKKKEKTLEQRYNRLETPDGEIITLNKKQLEGIETIPNGKRFTDQGLVASGESDEVDQTVVLNGKKYLPPIGKKWKTNTATVQKLADMNRLIETENFIRYKLYFEDFPLVKETAFWDDTGYGALIGSMVYVVQTTNKVIQRCLLMTTDPGDLVLDPTCGSGTTAYVAEQWGRRWITCDTSRVALTLARQRLMTANFDYFRLAHPAEGISSGFIYKTVPHITLKSIANNEPTKNETLYDQPEIDRKKIRITGPFTFEAVPSLNAKSLAEIEKENKNLGKGAALSGETLRQSLWKDELLKSGIRAKGGKKLEFTRIESMRGTRWIQCEAETREDKPRKVMVVFGPEYAPLDQRIVENAWQEAKPFKPDILIFCAFHFDEEAAKDIDELKPEMAGMQLLKAQMNPDMFTYDLKKKQSSSESFWLIGQPEVEVRIIDHGEYKGKFQVEVMGFDYYNPKTGNIDSGGKANIAMWLLDTNYDERSIFPSQIFFPMSGPNSLLNRLAKSLKAEIDSDKIEAFKGTVSLPFEKGDNKKIAVKIVDDRGIESLRIINL